MNEVQQRAAAKHFAEYWKGKGYEKGESQKFWLSLLTDVFGVEHAAEYIIFEDQVHLDHTSFIDGYIPATHVLIEQKGIGKDLKKPIRQSDGTLLKPIQQAQRYASVLPYSQRPRWIIVCNFELFHVYDMEHPQADPIEIRLEDLPTEYYLLGFLVQKEDVSLRKEMEVSIAAGDLVGKLYDAFLKEYRDPTNEHSLKSLNALCVRLVFCLYAEDAGIFGKRSMFHDYMRHNGAHKARQALIDLFRVLDTKVEDRDPYMDEELAAFPYVNGGLFSDENIEIPRINDTIFDLLLNKASASFDWSLISPTIFGAVFESTLNPETRRSGGMHYTSIENIHKVIDPLFLDDLKKELKEIEDIMVPRTQEQRLREFQNKLAGLKFLDPAAGSGNFLTESYLCLRRLENQALALLQHGQITFGAVTNPIKVSIGQFYGIEINDFAATVAKTALWIAESQMMKKTEDIVHMPLDFLPLKSYVNIVEGNALRIDWNDVVPKEELSYIMGNPPFVANSGRVSDEESHSKKMISDDQEQDRYNLFGKAGGLLDYVACWYKKASLFMKGTSITAAFVSTDSITQGQQVEPLWSSLFEDGIKINFAYRSFKWKNETNSKAATVFVVIIGFSHLEKKCKLFDQEKYQLVNHINAYLVEAPDIIIRAASKPICDVPQMKSGGKPVEGGYLIFSDTEKNEFVKSEPNSIKYFRRFTSGESYINNKMQWCLWLLGANPKDIKSMPAVMKRIELVREFRLSSKKEATRKAAEYPYRFAEIKQPDSDYLIIPLTTSRNRRYIPIGYLGKEIIANNGASFVPNATTYHFGVLTSNVHMAWMRAVCGYFGPSYRYSNTIVYNNFPWPDPTPEQKAKIEQTAQAILDARALYPDASLADLYDELTMPPELRKAHQQNDRAVMEAYGMPVKTTTESSCVAELMRRYQELTAKEKNV